MEQLKNRMRWFLISNTVLTFIQVLCATIVVIATMGKVYRWWE